MKYGVGPGESVFHGPRASSLHHCINIEQLLVMDVQTGSTLTPSKELLNTFSFVMGGGACARILECRFLAPYFPFIGFKNVWINLCLIAISAKQPILTVHQMLVCLLENCGFIIFMLVGIKRHFVIRIVCIFHYVQNEGGGIKTYLKSVYVWKQLWI